MFVMLANLLNKMNFRADGDVWTHVIKMVESSKKQFSVGHNMEKCRKSETGYRSFYIYTAG